MPTRVGLPQADVSWERIPPAAWGRCASRCCTHAACSLAHATHSLYIHPTRGSRARPGFAYLATYIHACIILLCSRVNLSRLYIIYSFSFGVDFIGEIFVSMLIAFQ
jgi:hypothetical protein